MNMHRSFQARCLPPDESSIDNVLIDHCQSDDFRWNLELFEGRTCCHSPKIGVGREAVKLVWQNRWNKPQARNLHWKPVAGIVQCLAETSWYPPLVRNCRASGFFGPGFCHWRLLELAERISRHNQKAFTINSFDLIWNVAKWRVLCHLWTLQTHPARVNQVQSDSDFQT